MADILKFFKPFSPKVPIKVIIYKNSAYFSRGNCCFG